MERYNSELGVILKRNKGLIDTFVDLSMCRLFDKQYSWFYESVPQEDIKKILPLIQEEDIRHDIFLFVIERYSKYKGKDFSSYLRLSLGLFVRDKLLSYINQYTRKENWIANQCLENQLDLNWVINESSLPLTRYEHYILYLYAYKCYPIIKISNMVYQDVSTIRKLLTTIKEEIENV